MSSVKDFFFASAESVDDLDRDVGLTFDLWQMSGSFGYREHPEWWTEMYLHPAGVPVTSAAASSKAGNHQTRLGNAAKVAYYQGTSNNAGWGSGGVYTWWWYKPIAPVTGCRSPRWCSIGSGCSAGSARLGSVTSTHQRTREE